MEKIDRPPPAIGPRARSAPSATPSHLDTWALPRRPHDVYDASHQIQIQFQSDQLDPDLGVLLLCVLLLLLVVVLVLVLVLVLVVALWQPLYRVVGGWY